MKGGHCPPFFNIRRIKMGDFLVEYAFDRIIAGAVGSIFYLVYSLVPILITLYIIYKKYYLIINLLRKL